MSKFLAIPLLILLSACLSGCFTTGGILNDVPECGRVVPQSLLDPTKGAALPESKTLEDGHDDAKPWQKGFVEQTGQLEKSNTKAPAVDHIYKECLNLHREQLKKSDRSWFGRLLGLNI